eukprot:TRINITY_DN4732_c0_g1_i1.p1 TRINITY_DN4732_c0_g1~~TRINITY_DN4732_c0_g1_i1.p1  ORF type:complete len:673 (-),score=111.87 TRINITY_DN4732_c0_g1_i1:14-2032(-)
MDCLCVDSNVSFGTVLVAASRLPSWQYFAGLALILGCFLYSFLEIHLIWDLLTAFQSSAVNLYYDRSSKVATHILPKCEVLKGRYWSTPWLCSPHLQTAFLHFFGRPPNFSYNREIFLAPDGGTIALDWLVKDAHQSANLHTSQFENDETPIAIIIPGLTSDSDASYARHISYALFQHGWTSVVANHRGLGGISITSDRFYNAGWTEDLRMVIQYLKHEHPKAPLLAVGTSIGANILVKYLGEEGENTPLAGAAAVCCPWDLVICDRFITRKLVQQLYDKILTTGLRGYAQMHQNTVGHYTDWECIKKSRSVRDFDHYFTIRLGKFETVDTYYRKCSSAHYISNISVPLLCINVLDDPVCTKEAIPWDECRANKNIILATTLHGGHLAHFEGLTAHSIWWVRAVKEFLSILHSSSLMHSQKKVETVSMRSLIESSIDKGPYLNVSDDGMVCTEENNYIQHENGKTEDQLASSLKVQQQTSDEQIQPPLSIEPCKQEVQPQENGENYSRPPDEHKDCSINLHIKEPRELSALQSILHQMLEQIPQSSNDTACFKMGVNVACSDGSPQSKANKESKVTRGSSGEPVSMIPDTGERGVSDAGLSKDHLSQKQGSQGNRSNISLAITKTLARLQRQQQHSIWILAYIAIITTWPIVGSLVLSSFKKRFLKYWKLRS